MLYIARNFPEKDIHTIKKENSYLSIAIPQLKFLDISNYLAAGSSYSQFLKAYGCDTPKGIFPYEWFDSFEKLDHTSLPDMQDFYSTLSNTNPLKSETEYFELKEIWSTQGMQTFKDYLVYYNNLDTGPFVTALSSFVSIYTEQKIDIFKDYVTLPGVARKLLYASTESNFSLINQQNADLYYTYRKNIVGGPSIIFSRYHEKGVSNIKKIEGNKCQSIVGYDCNGLYSYAIKQNMPTGVYVRRHPDNNFRPEISEKYMDSYVWMDYIMVKENIKILHKLNNSKEIRIGNFLVDGYAPTTKTVYEFQGCYYHYCRDACPIVKKIKSSHWLKKIKKTQIKDIRKKDFIISMGYKYVSIQQCDFNKAVKSLCTEYYDHYLPTYYTKNKGSLTENKIKSDIANGQLFGVLEVDISVKKEFKEFFSEFPPFFCTCQVSMSDIGEHMTEYCSQNDIIFDYKKLLISGTSGSKMLLSTPLLQWYLKNNCEITKIYQIIEYQPKLAFRSFIETVTKYRLEGDRDPDKAIIGETYKLVSNSSYGSLLMDKSKHSNVKYLMDISKVCKFINSPVFKNMNTLGQDLYEVETYKTRILVDTPIQIGFFILQYAKLRMLEFYYDCLNIYLKKNSFELTQTDTDSIYMAINQPDLDQCICEKNKDRYQKEIFNSCSDDFSPPWFPRRCCPHHIALDRRRVGIFKKEFEGCQMISLCSKSYIIQDSEGKQKISCKGISKKQLVDPMNKFQQTLNEKVINSSTNVGFRLRGSKIYTYSQEKIGFNYFYCKRVVENDGLSTRPLDMVLCSWEEDVILVEKIQSSLSNIFFVKLRYEEYHFYSLEQLYFFLLAKHYQNNRLCEQLAVENDCFKIAEVMKPYKDVYMDSEIRERIMRFAVLQKFIQCPLFREDLMINKNKHLVYKQPTFNSEETAFWGVSTPSKLVSVLKPSSLAGNNIMGQILMEYVEKLCNF